MQRPLATVVIGGIVLSTLHLGVGPRGRRATLDNALHGCGAFGLFPARAAQLIGAIVAVTRTWRQVFEELQVPMQDCAAVATAFRRASDVGMREVERHLA
ncbi:HipA domain-containing protein [Xanthomonas translucens DAR61454]|nr:HipA domain-containing protein [Xanthomonas translucens DAR61454]